MRWDNTVECFFSMKGGHFRMVKINCLSYRSTVSVSECVSNWLPISVSEWVLTVRFCESEGD